MHNDNCVICKMRKIIEAESEEQKGKIISFNMEKAKTQPLKFGSFGLGFQLQKGQPRK